MEDLENRSKRNNIVIWGLKEGAEAAHNFLEDSLRVEFFEKHMQLQNIEVMRAHRTTVNQRASEANTSTVRPIHIYIAIFRKCFEGQSLPGQSDFYF